MMMSSLHNFMSDEVEPRMSHVPPTSAYLFILSKLIWPCAFSHALLRLTFTSFLSSSNIFLISPKSNCVLSIKTRESSMMMSSLHNVVSDEVEPRMPHPPLHIGFVPAQEGVQAQDLVPQDHQVVHEVAADEPGSTGNKDALQEKRNIRIRRQKEENMSKIYLWIM